MDMEFDEDKVTWEWGGKPGGPLGFCLRLTVDELGELAGGNSVGDVQASEVRQLGHEPPVLGLDVHLQPQNTRHHTMLPLPRNDTHHDDTHLS